MIYVQLSINLNHGLFDHINHIREVKNKDYYKSLSEEEKKSFNKYMIIRFLSMDVDIIEDVSFVSKYFQNNIFLTEKNSSYSIVSYLRGLQ